MNRKLISVLVSVMVIGIGGYFFAQQAFGNTGAMEKYLDDTYALTEDYFSLMDEEATVGDSEEALMVFSEERLLPGLKEILERSEAIGETIGKEKLAEVHELHNESLRLHIASEEAWQSGEETAFDLLMQSDEKYIEYEEKLEKLAGRWGVKLEWEDWEEQ
ncbi:hypothetical protein [Alteribacter natronophilus]|uniref:hypothetical protein n=1 Tax=Alteribacter natronophilus TaxID=2583810 RepID=UPI00110E4151|nr:hypothetical protein [Alteribacter natronophilus]TMW71395.1 hypothetical protein FGB90_10105 [Alteribacter natronophilus]